mmetsp:Transcript_7873/g.22134  ORF Transcript_7873/g.22134 Transcript_7873/m.22134 type:complete len:253 (+) Transcript_7873:99-857(+)
MAVRVVCHGERACVLRCRPLPEAGPAGRPRVPRSVDVVERAVLRVRLPRPVLLPRQPGLEPLAEEQLLELLRAPLPLQRAPPLPLLHCLPLRLLHPRLLRRTLGEGGLQELHEIVGAGLRRELGRREAGGALGERVGAVLEQQAADALEPRRGRLHQRRLAGVVRAAGVHQPPREHLPDERFGLRGLERRQPHRREQRRLAQGVLPVLGRPVLQEEDEGLLGGRLAFPGLGLEPLGAPVQGRVGVLVRGVLE